jgi:hypothetical protein
MHAVEGVGAQRVCAGHCIAVRTPAWRHYYASVQATALPSALLLGVIIAATSFRAFVQAPAAMDAGVILIKPFLKVC